MEQIDENNSRDTNILPCRNLIKTWHSILKSSGVNGSTERYKDPERKIIEINLLWVQFKNAHLEVNLLECSQSSKKCI